MSYFTRAKALPAVIEKYEPDQPRAPKGSPEGGRFVPKTTDPATMTAEAVNKELDKLRDESSKSNQRLIDAGFGSVRYSDLVKLNHPEIPTYVAIGDRLYALRQEIIARTGKDYTSMPHGAKRRK